jgi:hypothetical protein
MSACEVIAAIPVFAGFRLAAFGDLITLTIETTDGNKYHRTPSHKRAILAYSAAEVHIYNMTKMWLAPWHKTRDLSRLL